MLLVSACLLGVNCKYNGGCNRHPEVLSYLDGRQDWIPICPEQIGGLATPRVPAEIQGGDGEAVLKGQAKVVTRDGKDVTEAFIKGAQEVLKIAQLTGAREALLKERSPSCGSGQIYDGTFNGGKIDGVGVTAALLKLAGFEVISEEDLRERSQ